jgi:hypothetical protein
MHRSGPLAAVVVALLCPIATPARAGEITVVYGIGGPAPVAPAPRDTYAAPAPATTVEPSRVRPKIIVVEPLPAPPAAPRSSAVLTNPVPLLLSDPTLRAGDIAMFPDGVRVFEGGTGSRRTLRDFVPLDAARRLVSPPLRERLSALRPGWIGAWSADEAAAPGTAPDARLTRRPARGFEVVRVGR